MSSTQIDVHIEQTNYQTDAFQSTNPKFNSTLPSHKAQPSNFADFSELIRVMTELLAATKEQQKLTQAQFHIENNKSLEPRDRTVTIPLPQDPQKLKTESLQKFMSELCQKVWSMTFNAFCNKEMSFESAKVYASEQILRNLARLCEQYEMGTNEFRLINKTIKQKVLDYMWHKYPMKLSQEGNRNLNKLIKEQDYTALPVNNYLSASTNRFKYRETAEYNDLIMKAINETLKRTNLRLERGTVFESFQNFIAGIFQTVMDNEIMLQKEIEDIERRANQSIDEFDSFNKLSMTLRAAVNKRDTLEDVLKENRDNPSQILSDKTKYRKKVEEYTDYKIGRKLPDSTNLFSEEDIASHNIKIENPQILRLMSKWCEQLQRKFDNPSYLENTIQHLLSLGQNFGEARQMQMREVLARLLKEEKAKIDKQMEQLFENNYMLQSELIKRELGLRQGQQIEKYELIAAKSSIGIVNNLHSYTIKYLNRLIHGLLLVNAKFSNHLPQLEANLPVITFQIMDLFRSRCASGEKEIICIYQEILRYCDSKKRLELVRVVNRLNKRTNDILINVRYCNVLCEIQLAVNRKNNAFIQHSNIFNHYIYELKRSLFGPLTELCSIWKCLDNRFELYSRIKDQRSNSLKITHRKSNCEQHEELQPCYKPFICSECLQHYYNNVYIKNHQKCKSCSYWICAKCEIKRSDCLSILQAAFKKEVVERCHKLGAQEQIPEYGICVLIEWYITKVEPFKKISINGVERVMGIKDKKIYEICEVNTEKEKRHFKDRYLVFGMRPEYGQKRIKIEEEQIREFFLEEKLKKVYLKHNDKICINREKLNNHQLSSLCNTCTAINKSKILRVDLADNHIQKLSTIAEMFPNTYALNVSQNNLKNFEQLERLTQLEVINLDSTKIDAIPSQIYKLPKLKEISANKNMICEIGISIGELKQLRSLSLSRNSIKVLPEQICVLPLAVLNLSDNQIKTMPNHLCQLRQLQNLNLQNNNLTEVNSLVKNLKVLKVLNLSHNQIKAYPQEINEAQSLNIIDFSFNQIQAIPHSINNLKKLKELNLSNNELNNQHNKRLPDVQGLWDLVSLDFSNNRIQYCPQFNQFSGLDSIVNMCNPGRKLKYLSFSYNQLKTFTNVQCLVNLQELKLNNNSLSSLDPSVGKLENLMILRADNNQLTDMPLMHLSALTRLCLNRNKIGSFHSHKLKKLQELDLSDNKLNHFSSNYLPIVSKINLGSNQLEKVELADYSRLKSITLSHNLLTSLPKLHQKCKPRFLMLENNSISELTEYISNLASLKQLNLAYNQIQIIPSYVQKLRSLEERSFELNGNPIKRIDCWGFLSRKATALTLKQVQSSRKDIVFCLEQCDPSTIKFYQAKQQHKQESDSEQSK